jgi:hypothetical protein
MAFLFLSLALPVFCFPGALGRFHRLSNYHGILPEYLIFKLAFLHQFWRFALARLLLSLIA